MVWWGAGGGRGLSLGGLGAGLEPMRLGGFGGRGSSPCGLGVRRDWQTRTPHHVHKRVQMARLEPAETNKH